MESNRLCSIFILDCAFFYTTFVKTRIEYDNSEKNRFCFEQVSFFVRPSSKTSVLPVMGLHIPDWWFSFVIRKINWCCCRSVIIIANNYVIIGWRLAIWPAMTVCGRLLYKISRSSIDVCPIDFIRTNFRVIEAVKYNGRRRGIIISFAFGIYFWSRWLYACFSYGKSKTLKLNPKFDSYVNVILSLFVGITVWDLVSGSQ